MQKVVYLILAYHLPEQAVRLATVITQGSSTACVFIHYDAKSGDFDSSLLQGNQRIELIPNPVAVDWGDWSQVESVLHSLNHIVEHTDFDWLVVVSGQDFPIKPIKQFETFLEYSEYDAYLEAQPLESVPRKTHTVARYYYRHFNLPDFAYAHRIPTAIHASWSRFLESLPEGKGLLTYIWVPRGLPGSIGVRARHVPFGHDFVCWQGSDWFNLSRRAVDYLLEFLGHRPDILRFYKHTFLPSESFYQSILFNATELHIYNGNLRFIIWDDVGDASPKTLTSSNLARMIDVPEFFERKFDPHVDHQVLDELEAIVAAGN